MLKNATTRRRLALMLVVLGGVLMFLAPETIAGGVLLAVGVSIELIGIALRHRDAPPGHGH